MSFGRYKQNLRQCRLTGHHFSRSSINVVHPLQAKISPSGVQTERIGRPTDFRCGSSGSHRKGPFRSDPHNVTIGQNEIGTLTRSGAFRPSCRNVWAECSAGTLPERCQNALNKPQNKKPPCCADSIPVSYLLYAFVAVTLPLLCHCVLFDCLC